MAKYRGKYQGKTRGKYVSRAYISNQNSAEENFDFARQVNLFMSSKGVDSGWMENDRGDRNCYGDINSYHVGGATISVKRLSYRKPNEVYGDHFVTLKMVSNDSLDDIIEMTLAEFLSFKEIDFNKIG